MQPAPGLISYDLRLFNLQTIRTLKAEQLDIIWRLKIYSDVSVHNPPPVNIFSSCKNLVLNSP